MERQEVALDTIDMTGSNVRSNIDAEEIKKLAFSIYAEGLLNPPVIALRGEGDDVTPILVTGFRRVTALKVLRDMVTTHNEKFNSEEGLGEVPEDYPFDPESEADFAYLTLDCSVVADDPGEILRVQIVENLQRTDLNIMDEITAINRLIEEADCTQMQASALTGKSQPIISQYTSVASKVISPGHEALRSGQITLKQALKLAAMVSDTKKPLVREQKAALEEMMSGTGSAGGDKRKHSDIVDLRRQLNSNETFTDADEGRKRVIAETLAWLENVTVDTQALVYGSADIDVTAGIPPVKEKKVKEEKAPKEPKAAKAPKAAAAAPKKAAGLNLKKKAVAK